MPVSTESPFASSANPSRASGLKSIFTSKAHKRVQSTGDAASNHQSRSGKPFALNNILPANHPHARVQEPLGERGVNLGPGSSSHPCKDDAGQGLHKKTKSSISLRSLLGEKDKTRSSSKSPSPEGSTRRKKPKKTKSSTSLSSLFKRSNRGRKDNSSQKEPDKENAAPVDDAENVVTPGWLQHDSNSPRDSLSAGGFPPSGRTLGEEMSLYTPRGYSPSKQRNFHDFHQPTLAKRTDAKPRPKSDLIASNPFLVRDRLGSGHQRRPSEQSSTTKETPFNVTSPNEPRAGQKQSRDSGAKRSSRILTAIPGFGSKEKRDEAEKKLDGKDIDTAFEELLVRYPIRPVWSLRKTC